MKATAKVRASGHSLIVTIPKIIIDALYLDIDDMVEIDVNKIEVEIKAFKCRKCEHTFNMEDDNPYCPVCECEDLEEANGPD